MAAFAEASAPRRAALAVTVLALMAPGARPAALTSEVLRSVGGLPPHIVGLFEEPLSFQQAPGGGYYVFDRRGHTVYSVDAARTNALKVVEIGPEAGRIIQPRGFDTSPAGPFVVADAPRSGERVQIFGDTGARRGGFTLPVRERTAAIAFGTLVLNGIASIQYGADSLLISHPESGALITEYSTGGRARRSIGRLRATGHEDDPELHLALNVGLPLFDPTGGYVYVFLAGRPMFQKYDAAGRLLFERHIEGPEIDRYLAALPDRWPTRRVEDRELPLVTPAIRAAAVDPRGQLWISLMEPSTYVYDGQGDKVRSVQFSAAGIISPTSLFFTKDGRLLVTPGCYEFKP
ncbi:MAG: hypothetical protein HYU37_05970 [Acidobacteria bacterium]|nr:hypothetical protein [Acidobacteriota bacterium]